MIGKPVRNFRDLEAWQRAMELALSCYKLALSLPSEERFELSAQLRRAAVSVPANIAEGHASRSLGLFQRHLGIALGSLGEIDTLIEVAVRAGLLVQSDVDRALAELARTNQVLHGLRRSVKRRLGAPGRTAGVLILCAWPLLR